MTVYSDWLVWLLEFALPRRYWYRNYYLRSRHWRKLRKRKLGSMTRCQVCHKSPPTLDIHHLTYERMWHERMSDLQVLCRSCHNKEHQ